MSRVVKKKIRFSKGICTLGRRNSLRILLEDHSYGLGGSIILIILIYVCIYIYDLRSLYIIDEIIQVIRDGMNEILVKIHARSSLPIVVVSLKGIERVANFNGSS